MTNLTYANLHHKSHYSCGLGYGNPSQIIETAIKKGLQGIAITDRCTLAGLMDAYEAGKKKKFPVILGSELDYADDLGNLFSIVLLIKNQEGYHNLSQLINYAHSNEYRYNKPACYLEHLRIHNEGLICLSSNMYGPWGKGFLKGGSEKAAQQRVIELKNIFGEDFYLELSHSNESFEWCKQQSAFVKAYNTNPRSIANKQMLKFSKLSGIPIVITSDSYIPNSEDKVFQDILINNTMAGKSGWYFRETRPLLTIEEIKISIKLEGVDGQWLDQPLLNTIEVLNKCKDLELKFKDQIVDFPWIFHPLYSPEMEDKTELVRAIVDDYGRIDFSNQEYKERFEYELNALTDNGRVNLIDYFLVIEDLCRWCRENGIVVGPGRGSGAGSLINYSLKITHLDPIQFGLIFERFISEGRIKKGTLPDIDLDFSDQKAAKQYLVDKYGEDRVKPIGTFQTLKVKSSIKDAFRLKYPSVTFQEVNSITAMFGKKDELETELDFFNRTLRDNEKLKEIIDKYDGLENLVQNFIGSYRQASIHPCGVAITQDPLSTIASVKNIRGVESLDFSGDACEKVGIIKYDILSLITLRYIQDSVKLILERHNVDIDIYQIPLDDKETFRQFMLGNTPSVFQFLSDIAKSILTKIEITSLDDLSMVTSIGRPGPMANQQHIEFIQRANKSKSASPPHEALREVLSNTYGIMIYQESVMKASEILGGFDLAEADDIRKAMGKKKVRVLRPYKDKFIKNITEKFDDVNEYKGEEIWNLMATFAGYGFNKSHAMCYAYIGYICMYLKTHYALEWWISCLKHSIEKPDKFKDNYNACKDIVNLPDINQSTDEFYITKDSKIQMPFSCVKQVGVKANEAIYKAREAGPFKSFEDFYNRVDRRPVHKGVMVKLIFADAFKEFGQSYEELLKEYFNDIRKEKKFPEEFIYLNKESVLRFQQSSLGFIDIDFYKIYPAAFKGMNLVYPDQLIQFNDGALVEMVGKVNEIKKIKTRKGDTMARVTMQNMDQETKITIFPDEFTMYNKKLFVDNVIKVKGKVQYYMNFPGIITTHIFTMSELMKEKK